MHIPAKALRDRDTVWIASQGEIQVRTVKIAHVDFEMYIFQVVFESEKKSSPHLLKGLLTE
ncbi:MAG: hypothetical protein CM1200mP30_15660 [Pseudomonadota bacterium]|nr:MAG: hypothetical protein CM1200mP30_15660 [Pseudomonadota bacterium]